MNKVIIHISDLHVTLFLKSNLKPNTNINSYLSTNQDKEPSLHFINTFTDFIKKEVPDTEFILLITGDISNSAEVKEFEFAKEFIDKIISNLAIKNENCLILPGDHDVHRRSIENELAKNPNENPHLLNEIKFENFASFYKSVLKKDFRFEKVIIDYIILDNKIVLLGINSNFHIDHEGGEGFISPDKFDEEFIKLKMHLGDESLNYIACWHHNFTAGYEDTNSGQWDSKNRLHLIPLLEKHKIKLVLTGNEHTSNSKSILMDAIKTSDCGTLTSINSDTTFKLYIVNIERNISLTNKIYALQKTSGNDKNYFWDIRTNDRATQPDSFELYEENKLSFHDIDETLPYSKDEDKVDNTPTHNQEEEGIFYNNLEIVDKLYNIIRDKKLFHTGHFHWSDTSRAHNWIDVSKLLENNDDLSFVKNAIIDIIETFRIHEKCDLIIGLGYEGNIISSKAAIKYNIPYTSLPYSYRYNDHHDYEKKLNFDNINGEFKNVIIITDVVNDGRTIRKLIAKREKDFFNKVEKTIVVSLFYTGSEKINIDILNFNNKSQKDFDFENDHEVNNIEFYTVKSLRVEKCPYGNDYKTACFIYKDELSCVHLFYDENNN